jgi:hypothetical protein
MVFWLPLVLSVVGTGYFLFFTEEDRKWKALALALTATGLALQLMPDRVPFLVPLLVHSAVAIWMAIYWKLQ